MTENTQDEDRRETYGRSEGNDVGFAAREAALGPYDIAWDQAIARARTGDPSALTAYVAGKGGYDQGAVEKLLLGDSDEAASLLCRAAGLPWESFEGILSYRARRFGRGPGMFGNAIRLYRDTSVEGARIALRRMTDS